MMMCRNALAKMYGPRPTHMRWLYTCVLRPQLTYGCYIWAQQAEASKKKLEKLERIGLKMCSFVRHSTPTDALRIIYNVKPLHLHIKEVAMNTYFRVKKYNWTSKLPKTVGHETYIRKLIPKDLQKVKIDKVSHRYVWDKPYTSEIGTGTIPPEFQIEFGPWLEELDSSQSQDHTWQIYTDGSLLNEKSGSGIVIFQNNRYKDTAKVRLDQATVYQSEVKAVQTAAEMVLSMKNGPSKCHIWLDNQAAIYELGNVSITQKCVLDAHNALLSLCKDGTTCDIRWVRGHSGVLGNEVADEAAKEGSKLHGNKVVMPVAQSTIKRRIKEKIDSLWAREWMSNPDFARQTKYFYKRVDPGKTKALLKYGKEATSRFIRFITGHAFTRKQNAYVAHGSNQGIPYEEVECRKCGEAKEEPAHIIRECEAFWQERLDEFNCLEWLPDMKWTIDQMMRFINKPQVRNLEDEQDTE